MNMRLVAGRIAAKGVLPPEALAYDAALLERVLDGLAARGVIVQSAPAP